MSIEDNYRKTLLGGDIRESAFSVKDDLQPDDLFARLDAAVAQVKERAGADFDGFALFWVQRGPAPAHHVGSVCALQVNDWLSVHDACLAVWQLNRDAQADHLRESHTQRRRRERGQK